MATVELRNISKQFQRRTFVGEETKTPDSRAAVQPRPRTAFAIKDLNLTIPEGKVMVILGPSGCGKSTLLRIIAGLEEADAGQVLYDGQDMVDAKPGDRQIGMVFQNYALYPQYTSRRNILSYFTFRKRSAELDKLAEEKYRRTSELMGIDFKYLLNRKPGKLSGGEQQRIAIARCITRDPRLFLMDEPFSNLDAKLRQKYRTQLKRLLRQFKITTVYVTHDQQEALALADLIAVMNIGWIEQVAPPQVIYHQPHNSFVAEFLNFDQETPAINLLAGAWVNHELRDMQVGIRPEDVVIHPQKTARTVPGRIIEIRPLPIQQDQIVTIAVGEQMIRTRQAGGIGLVPQSDVWLHFEKYHAFDKDSGRRIRSYIEPE